MSAGQRKEHFIQDTAELYFVSKVQDILEADNINLSKTSTEKYNAYKSYAQIRNVYDLFQVSEYKKNIDAICNNWVKQVFDKRKLNFDISCIEVESRAEGKKADFRLIFSDNTVVDFSLKNYKLGFDNNIQVCSGTWVSFVYNLVLESVGVGKCINPITKKQFSPGRDKKQRQEVMEYLGFGHFSETIEYLENLKDEVRNFYMYDQQAELWENIKTKWQNDCEQLGSIAANKIEQILNDKRTDKNTIKKCLLKLAGLDSTEEMLILGKQKYLCTFTSPKFGVMVNNLKSDDCYVNVITHKKNLLFSFLNKDNTNILQILVPFTLQKNGAWHLPDQHYEDVQFHEKEKKNLQYGQRRPKKSKEINTSVNTYYSLVKSGIV